MIRPEDIPDDQHAPRPIVEVMLETAFDCAIRDARDNVTPWPAVVRYPEWPDGTTLSDVRAAVWRVVDRYRLAGWYLVTEGPDRTIVATITRR